MEPTRITKISERYIPHNRSGGGIFYGVGIDETVFGIHLNAEDVARTRGDVTRLREEFIDALLPTL